MPEENVSALAREPVNYRAPGDGPYIPATDNEPGAPEALLKANRILRERRWPAPYDRTQHEMILGDARNLGTIPSESVHLVVTSPPISISSLTRLIPEVGSLAASKITIISLTNWIWFGENASACWCPAAGYAA